MIGERASGSGFAKCFGFQDEMSVSSTGRGMGSTGGVTMVTVLSSSKLAAIAEKSISSGRNSTSSEGIGSEGIGGVGGFGVGGRWEDVLYLATAGFDFLDMMEFAHDLTLRGFRCGFSDFCDSTSASASTGMGSVGEAGTGSLDGAAREGSEMLDRRPLDSYRLSRLESQLKKLLRFV